MGFGGFSGRGGLVGGFLGWFVLVWVLLVWLCFVLVWLFLSSGGLVWHRWHIGYGAIRWWCDEVWMNGQHWGISWCLIMRLHEIDITRNVYNV